jgi:hypothetical protein
MAIDIPSVAWFAGKNFKLASVSVERFDYVVELDGLFAVLAALDALHTVKKLLLIRLARPASANQKKLMAHGVVMPHVVFDLVPHEIALVFKAPRINDLKRLLQDRRSRPQEQHCIVGGPCAHRQCADFV